MKVKSLIKLGIVAVLIVVVAFLALNGLQVGKYILKPVGSAISLGLDLRGGVSTEYRVTDTTVDNYETLLDGTVSALRTRLTNAGFTEATVAIQGNDRILVEIPDVDDPEQVAEIIGTPAHLEFRDPNGNVVFEGKDIKSAGAQWSDETSTKAGVGFELNREATEAFAKATEEFLGQSISIYLDDELISAPTVNQVITGGQGIITSSASESTEESVEWANNLAMLIQSGALPLDIEEVETRAISATLGIQAIDGALLAGIVGLAIILIFMLVMYRLPGIAADLALLIYVLIVFYVMAIIGVQLTLQGVAGILLGIGMAVVFRRALLRIAARVLLQADVVQQLPADDRLVLGLEAVGEGAHVGVVLLLGLAVLGVGVAAQRAVHQQRAAHRAADLAHLAHAAAEG